MTTKNFLISSKIGLKQIKKLKNKDSKIGSKLNLVFVISRIFWNHGHHMEYMGALGALFMLNIKELFLVATQMWLKVFKVWWFSWKKGTLEIIFPRFGVLVLKQSSFYTDFALHGFSIPPKNRGERGPPVLLIMIPPQIIEADRLFFRLRRQIIPHFNPWSVLISKM